MDEDQEAMFAKFQRALDILKEAVQQKGIKDIADYQGEPLNLRWHVYKEERERDVILRMYISSLYGVLDANVSLLNASLWIMMEVESFLSDPNIQKMFKIDPEEDRSESVREHTRNILFRYINLIPIGLYRSFNHTLADSIRGYVKQLIEPNYQDDWQEAGMTPDFDQVLNKLKTEDEQLQGTWKFLTGDRRDLLTDERRAALPEEYTELRLAYDEARRYHDSSRKAFFSSRRKPKVDEWPAKWETLGLDMFPTLDYYCLQLLTDLNYQPFELAYKHLARNYGYSPDYMAKLVSKVSAARKRKGESDISKKDVQLKVSDSMT